MCSVGATKSLLHQKQHSSCGRPIRKWLQTGTGKFQVEAQSNHLNGGCAIHKIWQNFSEDYREVHFRKSFSIRCLLNEDKLLLFLCLVYSKCLWTIVMCLLVVFSLYTTCGNIFFIAIEQYSSQNLPWYLMQTNHWMSHSLDIWTLRWNQLTSSH